MMNFLFTVLVCMVLGYYLRGVVCKYKDKCVCKKYKKTHSNDKAKFKGGSNE